MIIHSIQTGPITHDSGDLLKLLDEVLIDFPDQAVLAITSKIVSLCEGNVVSTSEVDKETLVEREADFYLPKDQSKYGVRFTITNGTLIPTSGIDESNGSGMYVLWPKDAQKTANQVRTYLKQRFRHDRVGVVITDSTCHPMRRGTAGIMLAHSGFAAVKDYVGQPDIFGRPFDVSQADIAGGLTAAAVLQMGEGSERTPLAILSDLPFVDFQDRDPSPAELQAINITPEDDLFAPFFQSVTWHKGANRHYKT